MLRSKEIVDKNHQGNFIYNSLLLFSEESGSKITSKMEVFEKILDYCDLNTILNLRATCKTLNNLVLNYFCRIEEMSLKINKSNPSVSKLKSSKVILKPGKRYRLNIEESTQTIKKLFPNIRQMKICYTAYQRRCLARNLFMSSILELYSSTIYILIFKGQGDFYDEFFFNEQTEYLNPTEYFYDFSMKEFDFSMPNLQKLVFKETGFIEFSIKFCPNLNFFCSKEYFKFKFDSDIVISLDKLKIKHLMESSFETKFNVKHLTIYIQYEFSNNDYIKVKFHIF